MSAGYMRAGRRRKTGDIIRDIVLFIILLAFFLPALWIILTSMRPNAEINSRPPIWIPTEITFDSYKQQPLMSR